jgi:hypothetical protein
MTANPSLYLKQPDSSTELKKNKPEMIIKKAPPKELIIQEGDRLLLECEVSGNPSALIYWNKNHQKIEKVSLGKFGLTAKSTRN